MNTVLFLARADQGMVSPNRHILRLQDMLDKLAELHRPAAEDAGIALTAKVQAGRLHQSVIDSGKGIAAENMPDVFDRFFRADKVRGTSSGAGLGLIIVWSMAALHSSTVRIDSALGRGAEVTLILP